MAGLGRLVEFFYTAGVAARAAPMVLLDPQQINLQTTNLPTTPRPSTCDVMRAHAYGIR